MCNNFDPPRAGSMIETLQYCKVRVVEEVSTALKQRVSSQEKSRLSRQLSGKKKIKSLRIL